VKGSGRRWAGTACRGERRKEVRRRDLQGLGDGASGGSSGRYRNTRIKTRCRGMAAAAQRRAGDRAAA
jgi:hypothetical protein